MKRCSTCKQTFGLSEFHKNRSRHDGVHTMCKLCANTSNKNTCACGGPKNKASKMCRPCKRNQGPERNWRLNTQGYMECQRENRVIAQHREVMEEFLGRPLTAEESVHHKNGIRTDNRIENLELWGRYQPAGARIEDLLEFAHMIINKYEGRR